MIATQCTFCIHVHEIFHGETQDERNALAIKIQEAVWKYGCSDFFRAYHFGGNVK